MKDCVVKDWRVLCLLLLCTAVYSTTPECTNGTITVTINQPNLKAGRISICHNGEWKLICHHDWDIQDARVACRQLGFPPEEAQSCKNSCFGSNNDEGLTDFDCNGNESSLLQCSFKAASGKGMKCKNAQVAGVLCIRTPPATTAPPTCPPPATPPPLATHLPSTTCPPPTTCPTCATCPPPTTCPTCATCSPPTACPPPTPCPPPTTCPPPVTTVPLTSPTSPPCVCTEPPPTISAPTTPPLGTTPPPTTLFPSPATPPPCPTTSPCKCSNSSLSAGEGSSVRQDAVTGNVMASADASKECTAGRGGVAIGAALGAVSTLLLLTLVGVVTGWVWSCHRNKGKVKIRNNDGNFDNPTYSAATPTVPCVQYSSLGPQDTPSNGHTPPQEGEEGEYQEVEGGEGVYHVMGEGQVEGEGMVYEVPIQTQSQEQRDKSAGRAVEMAYSTLHHN